MTTIKLRPYQEDANREVINYWEGGGANPLVDMATGLGKSMAIAKLASDLCTYAPDMRLLMTVHVQELVAQNFEALLKVWPSAPVGIYSAGLQKRQLGRKVTYGSIQSIYNKADALGEVHAILIDEAHLVPHGDMGMYHQLIGGLRETYPDLRVVGYTATPYRTGAGRLDQGKDRLFDQIVYSYGIGDGVRDGWLAPLSGYPGRVEFSVEGIKRAGGEFVQSSLNDAFTAQEQVLNQALDEVVEAGHDRRSWLMFGAGVDHAYKIADGLRDRGIRTETVTGKTPKDEREKLLQAFKRGDIQALTNANVLTTGFDASRIDLIAMMRSTLSTNLYVQIMGRGTRVDGVDLNVLPTAELRKQFIAASPKPDCRILDYGGNIRRHGPVDDIWIKPKLEKDEVDSVGKVSISTVRARVCPSCAQYISAIAIVCPLCGYEDPAMMKAKHDATAEKDISPLSGGKKPAEPVDVMSWSFRKHQKYGTDPKEKPPTFRVDFLAGLEQVSEYLGFENEGFGRDRAVKWWKDHKGELPAPKTVDEAIERRKELRKPSTITVERDNGGYLRVVDRGFDIQNDDDRNAVRENRAPVKVNFAKLDEDDEDDDTSRPFNKGWADFDDEIPF